MSIVKLKSRQIFCLNFNIKANKMETNTLTAILNIVKNPTNKIGSYYQSKNRANNMGEALENYIKDMFAGTFNCANEQNRLEKIGRVFSYSGNQNNPPDLILRNGDAIEVKKIQNSGSDLALNSSYPKSKLDINNPMITDVCRKCEKQPWKEKDILYAVGVVNDNELEHLFFVYGVDYAASPNIYEKIKNIISSGITTIPDIEFKHTKELGRVNKVDPLGITYFRIRGMWGIRNPTKVFEYLYRPKNNCNFEFVALINNKKYYSFDEKSRTGIECLQDKNLNISDVKFKNPDNPVKLEDGKLITYCR